MLETSSAGEALDEILAQTDAAAHELAGFRLVADASASCSDVPEGALLPARAEPAPLADVARQLAAALGRPLLAPPALTRHRDVAGDAEGPVMVPPLPAMTARQTLLAVLHDLQLGCSNTTGLEIVPRGE